MSHQTVHVPGQNISSADADRTIALLKNSAMQYPSGTAASLEEQIGMEQLTPGLQNVFTTMAANLAGFSRFNATGDGVTYQFLLPSNFTTGTEIVYKNGSVLGQGDYTQEEIAGLFYLVFEEIPLFGDDIIMLYRTSQTASASVIGSFHIHHNDISSLIDGNNTFLVLGQRMDAPTGEREVYGINASNLSALPYSPVDVDSIPTAERDWPDMVKCGGFVWAIGGSSGYNTVTKIDISTMGATEYSLTTDTAATITCLATDNSYIYGFMEHGTYTYPNSFIKVAQDGTVSGLIYSGLTATGKVTTCVSGNGYLYASFDDASVKQVRKFDTSPANGLKKVFSVSAGDFLDTPTMIHPVDTYIYLIDGTHLHRISTISDTVTLLQTYGFTPEKMYYDGAILWISSGDTLYKCDKNGGILQTIVPSIGQNIQYMRNAFGFLWLTYQDELTNYNITKLYPGLANI